MFLSSLWKPNEHWFFFPLHLYVDSMLLLKKKKIIGRKDPPHQSHSSNKSLYALLRNNSDNSQVIGLSLLEINFVNNYFNPKNLSGKKSHLFNFLFCRENKHCPYSLFLSPIWWVPSHSMKLSYWSLSHKLRF